MVCSQGGVQGAMYGVVRAWRCELLVIFNQDIINSPAPAWQNFGAIPRLCQ